MWRLPLGSLAALLLSACHRAEPWAQATVFQEHRIYNACQAYASVNGHLPATLDDLVPDYLPDRHALGDPEHPEAGEIGYHYYGSGSLSMEPRAIILASKAEQAGQHALTRFSGEATVARFKPPQF